MSRKILFVAPPDQGAMLLLSKLTKLVPVKTANSEAEAKSSFNGETPDLVITYADIAASEEGAVEDGRYLGARMLAWMEERQPDLRSILISPVHDSSLSLALSAVRHASLHLTGVNLFANVINAVQSLIKPEGGITVEQKRLPQQNGTPERYLKLTVIANRTDTWTYMITGEGGCNYRAGPLQLKVKDSALSDLEKESRRIDTVDVNFRNELDSLGNRLIEGLLKNDGEFWGVFNNGIGRVAGNEAGVGRVKICFHVSDSPHPTLFFEALVSKEARNKFWMVEAPIYRTLNQFSSTAEPLFVCGAHPAGGPLSCLIIDADVAGPTGIYKIEGGKPVEANLQKLTSLQKECDDLEALLNRASKYKFERIVRMTKIPGDATFRERLIDVLQRNVQWDLVHFSGHSVHDDVENKGYLFLPPDVPGDLPCKFEIEQFASLLKGTRLLFLSGCESSCIDFLVSLARCQVAAAIGFRRKVVDGHAAEYAGEFYKQLLDEGHGCLQHAFLQAKQRMFHLRPNDWIWANPVLLVQSG